ncbi:hypothetical protein diail_10508 [Diaporthe ilicicola]|nr:hypothetical protein diail_10508 [Diaporthe ilicicola]
MAIIVYMNQVRAGTVETDRLVTYQPSMDRSQDVPGCIDLVVSVKGHYDESPGESSKPVFDKFMAHLSFGESDKVPRPGFEVHRGTLEYLETMVNRAKGEGLEDLTTCISIVDPRPVDVDDFDWGTMRLERALELLFQAREWSKRLGSRLKSGIHPAGLLKFELRSDGEFSTFDGFPGERERSDDLLPAVYHDLAKFV